MRDHWLSWDPLPCLPHSRCLGSGSSSPERFRLDSISPLCAYLRSPICANGVPGLWLLCLSSLSSFQVSMLERRSCGSGLVCLATPGSCSIYSLILRHLLYVYNLSIILSAWKAKLYTQHRWHVCPGRGIRLCFFHFSTVIPLYFVTRLSESWI